MAIDALESKITETKTYVASEQIEKSKTDTLIASLKTLTDDVDQQVADVTNNLTSLINSIGNSFELKNGADAATMLPSTVTNEQLQMQSSKMLENQTLNFTTQSYDEFGRVLVSGSIKYGNVTQEFNAVPLSIKFQKTERAYNFLLNNTIRDIVDIKNKTTIARNIKTDLDAVKSLQAKITEFLALTEEKYQDILKDKVALYLWAEEASKDNTVDKDVALETVKTNFINKTEDTSFLKLNYLTQTTASGRWTKLERLIKLFVFANNPKELPTSDAAAMANEVDLMPYKETKFADFIKGFYNDFILKYFTPNTPNTMVPNGAWVLFEFTQPWLTTRMFLLLEDKLTEDQKQMTFQTLKRFTDSISNYGTIKGSNSSAGTKLIDNFTHFSRIFFVRNWLNLYNQNIKEALKDAQDYKKWIETVDFEAFTKDRTTREVLNYINTIRLQNDFYNQLKTNKTNLKFDAVSFDNLTNWFLDKYLLTNITFEKAVATGGEELLRIVAVFYLSLTANPTQRSAFLTKLKASPLLAGKTYEEFKTQIDAIRWGFAKTVWETTILPKS